MQSEVINRLRSAIEYVEADKAQDYAHAETTGERVDLNDYDVSLSLEDAKALEAALSAAEPAKADCKFCKGSGVEFIVAGHGNINEEPCSTCGGTGKEGRHSICRDCDEIQSSCKPFAFNVRIEGWGEELLYTEDGAKSLIARLRRTKGQDGEVTITPLYAALSAQVQDVAIPVAWRYRHDPTVQWSYSESKHPRNDLEQEPLFVGQAILEKEKCRGHRLARKLSDSIQNCESSIATVEPAMQCGSSLTLSSVPTEMDLRTPHTNSSTRKPSDEFAVVPLRMTADMINAWTGGLTVSTDENAYHTTFQDAWARVLAAAPAQVQDVAVDAERVKAAFNHGYVIACCNVTNLHDEPGIAHDALRELGVTKAEVKRMGLCDYDAKALREIERARGPNSAVYAAAPAKQGDAE